MTRPSLSAAAGQGASPWAQRSVDASSHAWASVAESQDGAILVAADGGGNLWRSTDSGVHWMALSAAGVRQWQNVAISSNGAVIVANWAGTGAAGSGGIAVSANGGTSFSFPTLPHDPTHGLTGGGDVAISGSGAVIAVSDALFAEMFMSSNTGGSFATIATPSSSPVKELAISRDGGTLLAAWSGAPPYAAIVNNDAAGGNGVNRLVTFDPTTGAILWSGGPSDLIPLTGFSYLCIDSAGCVIVMATPSTTGFTVQKIAADGKTSLWTYVDTTANFAGTFLGVDHIDNVYVGTQWSNSYATLHKLSPSGSLLATAAYVPLGAPRGDTGMGVFSFEVDNFCVTPSGVAICGGVSSGLYPYPPHGSVSATITGSFAATWNTGTSALYDSLTGGGTVGYGVAADAAGNVYAGYRQDEYVVNQGEKGYGYLLKVDSLSGAFSAIHSYGGLYAFGVADVDAAGNVYGNLTNGNAAPNTYTFQKLSNSGSILWSISEGTTPSVGGLLAACADGFIYQDPTHGMRKLSGADGTTVLWTNATLCGGSGSHDNLAAIARPQY